MPYLLEDLVIDRVDLVDEGANSAAFIELYKRKEQSKDMTVEEILAKMKPEHSQVISEALAKAKTDAEELAKSKETINTLTAEKTQLSEELKKAKEAVEKSKKCSCGGELDESGKCKACGNVQKTDKFDEKETLEKMSPDAKRLFEQMKVQRDAAEAELRKAKDAEKHAEAVAKASELKALPIETEKLVGILKSCSQEVCDVLTSINAAIEGTVLTEVGKSHASGSTDTWSKIENKAAEIAKRDSITKQKAISVVIKENPELYREYLEGGAN